MNNVENVVVDAVVSDVVDGCYILNANDGIQYKLPTGIVEVKNGQLVHINANKYLKLVLPEGTRHEDDVNRPNEMETQEEDTDAGGDLSDEESSNCEQGIRPAPAEWSVSATKVLIELYKENKLLVEQRKIKTLKRMWELLTEKINNHGYCYTAAQCENKWKSLERSFKNKMENKKKTGRGKRYCPYEKELMEILIHRASIAPPTVMDAKSVKQKSEVLEVLGVEIPETDFSCIASAPESNTPSENTTESCEISFNTPTSSKTRSATTKEIIKLREAIEKRSEEKKVVEDKKIEQRERLIMELTRKNDLLERLITLQTNTSNN